MASSHNIAQAPRTIRNPHNPPRVEQTASGHGEERPANRSACANSVRSARKDGGGDRIKYNATRNESPQ
eukprot:11205539-Alexandrium_andersonii.AAC.1